MTTYTLRHRPGRLPGTTKLLYWYAFTPGAETSFANRETLAAVLHLVLAHAYNAGVPRADFRCDVYGNVKASIRAKLAGPGIRFFSPDGSVLAP